MPEVDTSQFNVEVTILGIFLAVFALFSHVIKEKWYLGEALPAVIVGMVLGPFAAKFIIPELMGGKGGMEDESYNKVDYITVGVCRIVIGTQLVVTGFQLPKKYILERWKDLLVLMIPLRVVMWLITSSLVLLVIPKMNFLTSLVIGACVTCTDPVLTQAIARGAFADKFVPRHLREIISAEAGATDGFGFPFLMLAIYLMRSKNPMEEDEHTVGGGNSTAITSWVTETLLWYITCSAIYGAAIGYSSAKLVRYVSRRRWIEGEMYLLWAIILGLFLIGSCGLIGTDDFTACFACGCFLNWDGHYHAETTKRQDDLNPAIETLLNLGAFAYIGAVMPWDQFNRPEETGITYAVLIGLAFLVLLLRRMPAMFMAYKGIESIHTWREALFMGYFGPIGIGAIFYVEHSKHLLPEFASGAEDENSLHEVMTPVVYFLVLSSILVHGLSIPALSVFYNYQHVPAIQDPHDVAVLPRRSRFEPLPANAIPGTHHDVVVFNRFSRPEEMELEDEAESRSPAPLEADIENAFGARERTTSFGSDSSRTAIVPPDPTYRGGGVTSVWSRYSEEGRDGIEMDDDLDKGKQRMRPARKPGVRFSMPF
ncbi:Na(+)/H(+) antiporter 1 [Geopyxis carbonaria]|nr:Na(+)/H(+) antiporter 1 [Geopyxis carbonaria]